ncbi:hypothetical protein NPIL_440611 [Nephila pilipes]|uniref:Uncharacterized protein n=1 Tax=Nephila pilipes TaxID=299642 RepID=A0A8X6R0X2_NEPPI|nr:hypothetical protein NPIL_440611 [Nephila pilipes]
MLRTGDLTTEESMSLFEFLTADCSNTPVESPSDEDMSIDDPPVASSSGFKNAGNVDSCSDEDLEEQSVSRIWKKRNATIIIPTFSLNSEFIESFLSF